MPDLFDLVPVHLRQFRIFNSLVLGQVKNRKLIQLGISCLDLFLMNWHVVWKAV